MTIAQSLKDSDMPFDEVVEQADTLAVDADQEWEQRQTTFTFGDGSYLKAKYPDKLEVF